MPDGRVGHAEIRLGDSLIMLSDEFPEFGGKAPDTLGGTPVNLHLYVEDVDAVVKRALEAGATERKPVTDQFYGTARVSWRTHSDMSGGWPPIRRMCRRTRCRSASRPWSPGTNSLVRQSREGADLEPKRSR
jgi:hypothetical protein